MRKSLIYILFLFCFLISKSVTAQKKIGIYAVAFYNVENLFDTELNEEINDHAYTPTGAHAWTDTKYWKKQSNIAYAIDKLAAQYTPAGPAVIGLAEVENKKVLDDLVQMKAIADRNYQVVHYDSPDRRGIDVGLLYNPSLFKFESSLIYPYKLEENSKYRTRDILLVNGKIAGDQVHIIVGHWPSRWGGAEASSKMREHAAAISKHISDSLYQANPKSKIIIMGDLNDNPDDKSVAKVLDAKRHQKQVKEGGLYNTMWEFWSKGIGSLGYQGKWSLFDQIIVSESLLGKDRSSLKFWKAEIFNKDFLTVQEGKTKGYPHRTFSANTFIDGYSDHFPTLIYLVKEVY